MREALAPVAVVVLLTVLAFLLVAVIAMTVRRPTREDRGARREGYANGDPAIEEARSLRAESRETRMRIEESVAAGRPTASLFDRAMNIGKAEDDEGERGRKDT